MLSVGKLEDESEKEEEGGAAGSADPAASVASTASRPPAELPPERVAALVGSLKRHTSESLAEPAAALQDLSDISKIIRDMTRVVIAEKTVKEEAEKKAKEDEARARA